MITLFLLTLVIKITGVVMIYGARLAWEIIAFLVAFLVAFVSEFIRAAKLEYKRIKTA
jgi:hypothetical protein